VNATPDDATVRVGNNTIASGNSVELAPGQYQVQVTKDGYTPFTQQLTVVEGQPVQPIEATLTPLPPSLQLFVDMPGAKVSLNDGTPEEVPGGMIVKEDLPAAKHKFVVEGRGRTTFEIEIAPQTLPSVPTLTPALNLQTMIIASYRDQVRIRTSLQTGKVVLNGNEVGQLKGGYIEIPAAAGKYDVVLGEGDSALTRSLEVTNRPLVAVYVGANTNLGYLIATISGAPDAQVKIDGKDRGTAKNGTFQRTLEPKDYTVEFSREGYVTETRPVSIKKGAPTRLEIALNPVVTRQTPAPVAETKPVEPAKPTAKQPGTLTVNVVPPDAEVTIALQPGGTPQPFRKPSMPLPDGSYLVSARAQGYSNKSEGVVIHPGQPAQVSLALTKIVTERGMNPADWDGVWSREEQWFVREPGGIILHKPSFWGTVQFDVRTREAGWPSNPRVRIVTNVADARNYTLIEIGKDDYQLFEVKNGNRVKQKELPLRVANRIYSVILTLDANRTSIRINNSFSDDFGGGSGRFGFLVDGKDKIYLANFKLMSR
jgi:hypothetical protein